MNSQLESISSDVKEIKTDIKDVVHDRISRTNAKTDENRQTISRIQGGIKALWGVITLLGVLASGLFVYFVSK